MSTTVSELIEMLQDLVARIPEAAEATLCTMEGCLGGERELAEFDVDLHYHKICFADGTDVGAPGEDYVVLVDGNPGPPEYADEDYCHTCCELTSDCVCGDEGEDDGEEED